MESLNHRHYREKAEGRVSAFEALADLANHPEAREIGLDIKAEQAEAERDLARADLLDRLARMTGFPFAVYAGHEMPGAAAFVKTNGEKIIYIADHVLDDPDFADHVAKHEAFHLKTLLILPVETDFTPTHFETLNRYLPETFKNNVFYLEGLNEWLTSLNDNLDESVTAYSSNVAAAKQLEALAFGATGESLMEAFKTGNGHNFARVLKTTTDRLMLHEALETGDYTDFEKARLKTYIKLYPEPVNGPEKAELIIETWQAKLTADALKAQIRNGQVTAAAKAAISQRAMERKERLAA